MNKKAIIAMSGGVDSSVAAYLMKQRGFDCIGVTMKLYSNEDIGISRDHSCCSLDDVEDARSVAYMLGMPHFVFNFSKRFEDDVINKFIYAYEHGQTPNPCIDCNRYLKFDKLFQRAAELECDYVVTGHYARIESENGRFLLKKAVDEAKDQSYVLYSMTQYQLEHTMFPLGDIDKTQTRTIAEKNGFINAQKHDSQDICFVQNGRYVDFIKQKTGREYPEGDFVDKDGNVLGRHCGIICYTVGQRKGLGLSFEKPHYVCGVNPENNTVILGLESDLYSSTVYADDVNLIAVDSIEKPMRVTARVRYHGKEQPATVEQIDNDRIRIDFDVPQRAATKGQAVVMYDGDTVIGGGTITDAR